ncbi:MAG: SRPBCC domain-containing protein [Chloroflexota bacterium]|nr:SRPBCC domain-containing protein [Chloroflexota bacterium]
MVGRRGVDRTPGGWDVRGALAIDGLDDAGVALCTPDTLAYSWSWDHEPDQPARTVIVRGEPDGGGTILTLTHGPYRPSSPALPGEDEDRAGHRDGWLHFLPKLHEAIAREGKRGDR